MLDERRGVAASLRAVAAAPLAVGVARWLASSRPSASVLA